MSLLLDALKRAEEAKRAKADIASDASLEAATTTSNNALKAAPINELEAASIEAAPIVAHNAYDYSVLSLSALDADAPAAFTAPVAAISPNSITTASRATTSIKPMALSTDNELLNIRQAPLGNANLDTTETLAPTISAEETALAELLQIELDSDASYRAAVPNTSPATAAYRAARSQSTKPIGLPDTTVAAIEPVTSHTEQAQRDAVKNAFSVKQSTRQPSRAKWVLPVIGGLLFFVSAGSWYVWQEINRGARTRIAANPNPNSPAPIPTTVTQALAQPTTQSPSFAPNTGIIASPTVSAAQAAEALAKAEIDSLPPLLPPPAIAIAAPLTPKSKVATVTYTPREALAKKIEDLPISPPSSASSVKLRAAKTEANDGVGLNPTLTLAYAALSRGDYATAKQSYANAIEQQPTNIDANLGFATAAARTGENEMAVRYYRRVLALDPRNATAAAALLTLENKNTSSAATPISMESELNLLIEKAPNVAASHFALGNVMAGERRWREAQQAFFEAARLTPSNPDYLYNLAVSLDHLGQLKQAEDFYRRALAATALGQAQFDPAIVEKRLSAIANSAANNAAIK
jgi:Tfp pilus assembly protein PilF